MGSPDTHQSPPSGMYLWKFGVAAFLPTFAAEFQNLREDMTLIRHDVQKVWECTSALEGRVIFLEDELAPVKLDVLANQVVVQQCANHIDMLPMSRSWGCLRK